MTLRLEEARAESADRMMPEWDEADSAAPFIMADDAGALVARGAGLVLAAAGAERTSLGAAGAALLGEARDEDGEPLIVGALPFASDRPANLFRPRSARRLSPDALARELGVGGAAGETLFGGSDVRLSPEPPRRTYEEQVAAALKRLGNGSRDTLRKVVLARTLDVRLSESVDVRAVVARLYADRSATTFCVPLGVSGASLDARHRASASDGAAPVLVGATPELLLEKRGARVVSRPLAGSTRRWSNLRADRAAAAALARSAKDRLEHALVVEHVADTLAPHCSELRVPASPELISTSTMWHLGTTVQGTLRDDCNSALELAAELHPTPAVCGLPRELAMATIGELESFDRGYFAGTVGWCDARGDGRWMVAIRCAEVDGANARLYAGAGIVAGSEPAAEAAETAAKFATMLRALGVEWRDP